MYRPICTQKLTEIVKYQNAHASTNHLSTSKETASYFHSVFFYTSKLATNGISPLEKIFIDSYTSHAPTMHESKSFVSVCNSFLLVAFPSIIN